MSTSTLIILGAVLVLVLIIGAVLLVVFVATRTRRRPIRLPWFGRITGDGSDDGPGQK